MVSRNELIIISVFLCFHRLKYCFLIRLDYNNLPLLFKMLSNLVRLLLKTVYRRERNKVRTKYNRTLPFGDYFSDRWEKSEYLGFGEGTSVYDNVLIIGDVCIGKECWIGPNCILDGSGGKLSIGDHCSISAGVHIYTHNSVKWALHLADKEYQSSSVIIGNNNYIGPNSVIAMGSSIGNQCVIGALTFINGFKVPNGSKVYGSPGRIQDR